MLDGHTWCTQYTKAFSPFTFRLSWSPELGTHRLPLSIPCLTNSPPLPFFPLPPFGACIAHRKFHQTGLSFNMFGFFLNFLFWDRIGSRRRKALLFLYRTVLTETLSRRSRRLYSSVRDADAAAGDDDKCTRKEGRKPSSLASRRRPRPLHRRRRKEEAIIHLVLLA